MSTSKKFCTKCNKQIPDDAKVCDNCGSQSFRFEYPEDKQSESSQSKSNFTWSNTGKFHTCIACGKYRLIENKHCSSCGAYQVDKSDMKDKEDDISLLMLYNIMHAQFKQTKMQRIISIIILIAAIIFLVSAFINAIYIIRLLANSHRLLSLY